MSSGSLVLWDGVAVLGGPGVVMDRAMKEPLNFQCYDADVTVWEERELDRVTVDYDSGVIDVEDLAYENTTGRANHGVVSLAGVPFADLQFGGYMSVVKGTFTVVFNVNGIVEWKGVMDYHDALVRACMIHDPSEIVSGRLLETYRELRKVKFESFHG